jgi:hypothetical protein
MGGKGVAVGVAVDVGVGVANKFLTACGTKEQLIETAAIERMNNRVMPAERFDIMILHWVRDKVKVALYRKSQASVSNGLVIIIGIF